MRPSPAQSKSRSGGAHTERALRLVEREGATVSRAPVRRGSPGGWVLALAIVMLAALAPVASAREISEVNPPLQKLAEEQEPRLAAHLGFSLSKLHLVVGYTTEPAEDPHADTITLSRENGPFSLHGPVCQVAVNKAWWGARTHYEMEEVLVHEVFHCFEHQIEPNMSRIGKDGAEKNEGDWIIEGLDKWAELTLFPLAGEEGLKTLTQYYATPSTSLFARSYDAVGFWAHVQDLSGELWQRIPAILRAGANEHNQPAANAAVPASEEESFFSSWGSSAFDLQGEEIPTWLPQSPLGSRYWPEGSPPAPQTVDGSNGVALAPYTIARLRIVPRGDKPLIQIHLDPHAYGRFGVTENYTGKSLEDKTFCAAAECSAPAAECPSGDVSKLPPLTPLPTEADLGVATGGFSSSVQIRYFSAQYSGLCEHPEPPSTPGGSGSGGSGSGGVGSTASSFGDPHLIGFGGIALEFQAAGEFTLVKSTNAHDLEIQARQQPEFGSMSVDTAVALRVGGAVVEVDRPINSDLSVLVNHRPTRASRVKLAGGGSLEHLSLRNAGTGSGTKFPGVKVRWRDGTYVEIPENYIGLSLLTKVAPNRLGHLTGLLGDAGATAAKRFLGREHKPYTPITLERDEYIMYRKYGASWRISQRESLFTYARHKNTHSYTLLNYPRKHFNEGGVPLAKALHAEAICRDAGSTNLALVQDCEYDVLLSGNTGYAAGDALAQSVSEPGPPARAANTPGATGSGSTTPPAGGAPAPGKPSPPPAIDLGAGQAQPSLAYDSSSEDTYVAWQDPASQNTIDLCVVPSGATACNGGSGPYKLTDPLADSSGSAVLFAVKALVMPGGTVVVLGDIAGESVKALPLGYPNREGVIAWSSAAGGAAFATAGQGLANGGKLLAVGAGYMPGAGAVALDSTHIATYGNSHPFGSGVTDFTLAAEAPKTTPLVDHTEEFGDQEFVDGAQIAAELEPGSKENYVVVVVGGGSSPKGCSGDATGYGVAKGKPEALQKQTAWEHGFTPISCEAFAPVLTGGGPGKAAIGLVQTEGPGLDGLGADGIYYRPFNTTSDTFSAPVPISEETPYTLLGASELSASEDSAGGLYACWADTRGVMLAHSSDGGASWQAPSITGIEGGGVVVTGTSPGQAAIAYTSNPGSGTQEYLALSL
jgi:hypothetical protein